MVTCPFCCRVYEHILGTAAQKALVSVSTDSGFHYFCKSRDELLAIGAGVVFPFPYDVNTFQQRSCFSSTQDVLDDYDYFVDSKRDQTRAGRALAKFMYNLKRRTGSDSYGYNNISFLLSSNPGTSSSLLTKQEHRTLKWLQKNYRQAKENVTSVKYLFDFYNFARQSPYSSVLDTYVSYRRRYGVQVTPEDQVQTQKAELTVESAAATGALITMNWTAEELLKYGATTESQNNTNVRWYDSDSDEELACVQID